MPIKANKKRTKKISVKKSGGGRILRTLQSSLLPRKTPDQYLDKKGAVIKDLYLKYKSLIEQYKNYLSDDYCDRVVFIKNKHINGIKRVYIDKKVYQVGFIHDDPYENEKYCVAIKSHYLKRRAILDMILNAMIYSSNCINSFITGPVCLSDYRVFEKSKCPDAESMWKKYVDIPDSKVIENREWFKQYDSFFNSVLRKYSEFGKVIENIIKNGKNISDKKLSDIEEDVVDSIQELNTNCKVMVEYLNSIDTYTKFDIMEKEKEQKLMDTSLKYHNKVIDDIIMKTK